MKFGDIVINHWASESNPTRIGCYIRKSDLGFEMTDCKGQFWVFVDSKDAKLEIVGSVLKCPKNPIQL